ncbi:Uncharacterised protein [Helicobacter mustelae]|uniref:hypothetical protein n=1 Tax=Helicobacter mustelae TaxID=217 RepID=UPI000DFB1E62|nr:hypothetical protein [Helicobacter mustelae]STP13029.1 Uncharacterised protein [Helicobacter mustelae]
MKRNYWPLGILIIIFIGVLLLVALVYISLVQPNINDNSYLQKSSSIEKSPDLFLGATRHFAESYEVLVKSNEQKDHFIPPYLLRAKKIEEKIQKPLVLKPRTKNILQLEFLKKKPNVPKILHYGVYMIRYYDKNYKDKADLLFEGDDHQLSFDFAPKKEGRYKLILQIAFEKDGKREQAYLQRDFLVQK